MPGREIEIATEAGAFMAYVAEPEGPVKAGLLVLQEAFGVNAVMRAQCDEWAGLGYRAVCPDLFWRMEPRVQLSDKSEADWKRAFALYNAFDVDLGVQDIAATVAHMRGVLGLHRVGTVGYCLGGLLSYLAACRTDVDASVAYYGVGIEKRLEESEKLARPVLLHVAGQDKFVPKPAQDALTARLGAHPLVQIHVYPEQDHAFARLGGEHYDAAATALATARTRTLLSEHLQ